jgi:DNA-binding transcriptional MocR family regulator
MMSELSGQAGWRYEQLAGELWNQIETGILKPGDRLPSIRQMCRQKGISLTTVCQAYQTLEDRGLIEAQPQSGYYVRWQAWKSALVGGQTAASIYTEPRQVQLHDLPRRIREDAISSKLVQFGAAVPAPDLIPSGKLNHLLTGVIRSGRVQPHLLGSAQGCPELRTQIARRAYLAGSVVQPEDVVITNGCTEAIYLALRATCKPGEMIAIESPSYFGTLQTIESLDLRVVEIPCDPRDGIDLEALGQAIQHHPIRAVIAVTNFSNPLGACMPDEKKRLLVEMLAQVGIPLIEDDLYGDLHFSGRRPLTAHSFDRQGEVILCSSFSKSLSPGYRVGWLIPGRWTERVEQMKAALNLFTPEAPQLAIAGFLENAGFDHSLRVMRRAYSLRVNRMADCILRTFPAGTRVSTPQGGYVLWIQMPEQVDSLELYRLALAAGITLAPGYLFSVGDDYRNYIRLNAAMFSEVTRPAVEGLGRLAVSLAE